MEFRHFFIRTELPQHQALQSPDPHKGIKSILFVRSNFFCGRHQAIPVCKSKIPNHNRHSASARCRDLGRFQSTSAVLFFEKLISSDFVRNQGSGLNSDIFTSNHIDLRPFDRQYRVTYCKSIIFVRSRFLLHPAYDTRISVLVHTVFRKSCFCLLVDNILNRYRTFSCGKEIFQISLIVH
jgi:hypothetical protein